jgi:hypothetical protein
MFDIRLRVTFTVRVHLLKVPCGVRPTYEAYASCNRKDDPWRVGPHGIYNERPHGNYNYLENEEKRLELQHRISLFKKKALHTNLKHEAGRGVILRIGLEERGGGGALWLL